MTVSTILIVTHHTSELSLYVQQRNMNFILYSTLAIWLSHAQSYGSFKTIRLLQDETDPEKCCAVCLNGRDMNEVDAVDWLKCRDGGGGCCFEDTCKPNSLGSKIYDDTTVKFDDDGEAYTTQGQWIQLQWPTVDYITYIVVNEGQNKDTQPKNNSQIAHFSNDWHQLCAQNPGMVYYRGWRDNGCAASVEYSVRVGFIIIVKETVTNYVV